MQASRSSCDLRWRAGAAEATMTRRARSHDPKLDALLLEELAGARAAQRRERRQRSGFEARAGEHGDGARRSLDRPSRAWVENVAEAPALPHHEAPRVAARRQTATLEIDAKHGGFAGAFRVVDAGAPWSAAARAIRVEVAAKVHDDGGTRARRDQ